MPRAKPIVVEQPLKPNESDLVIIDATLMIALDTPKDRAFILDIEAMLLSFIQNPRYYDQWAEIRVPFSHGFVC
jgi:hypothetical protein